MAASTGPVLALGAITVANQSVIHSQPFDWRVPIATGLLAGVCALLDKGVPGLGTGLAYVALAAVLLTRVNPAVPSPTESFAAWWAPGNQK
jgi:hypothetical protein